MSNDRISGMLWGFNIGFSIACSIENPIWILWAIGSFAASYWFAKHPEYNR